MALPELREAEAPPDIAAIYAALRKATGVPLVNLIWRHLATLPGVLPWAWAAVRPALEDGSLQAARTRLGAALPLPPLAPVDAAAWKAAGLAPELRSQVLGLVETYNRGNLSNLILLTALRRALEGVPPATRPPVAAEPAAPEGDLAPVPPLPVLAALAPETRAQVQDLAARHGGEKGVIPSLYLHLAHWPPVLAALPGWIGPLLEPATLASGRSAAIRLATVEADGLRARLAPVTNLPGSHGPAVLAVLSRFTLQVIPDMVPIGLALRRSLRIASA